MRKTFVILTTLISCASFAQTYTYDSLKRLSQISYPNNVLITYKYDANGNRINTTTTSGICPGTQGSFYAGTNNLVNTTYQWEVNQGSGFVTVSNNANYSGATTPILILNNTPASWYGYTYRCSITVPGGQTYSNIATLKFTTTWLGGNSVVWEDPSNWSCSGVPDANMDVVINGNMDYLPTINSSASCRNLLLGQGTALNLLNNQILNIKGDVTNAGSVIGPGIVALNGITTQNINGIGNINNLTLNNASGASIASGSGNMQNIYGTLIVTTGTLTTGDNLTLKSDSNGTARVGNSTGVISGNVTVERNIQNSGHRSWHLLSVPTTGSQTIYNAWQESGLNVANKGTLITSNLYSNSNGFDMVSNSASILTHNQGGVNGPTWNYLLSNTNITQLAAYPGYMLFVRGDRNYTPTLPSPIATNRTVLKSYGTLRQGTQGSVTISATGSGRTLVGNPYASPIDMENVFTGTPNLDQSMYIWDPTLTGNYGVGGFRIVERVGPNNYQQTPIVLGGGANPDATAQFIHSGQAFFLKASGSDASVVFTENHKTGSVSTVNPIINSPSDQQLFVNLMIVNSGNITSLADGIRVRFDAAYNSNTSDDILKMGNFAENIASYREGKKLIVEKRPMIQPKDTIFLRMTNTTVKDYQLEIGTINFIQPGITAILQDTYLNTNTALNLNGPVNNIGFSVTSDPASANQDRFRIVFATSGPLPVTITSIKAYQQSNDIAVEWKVSNQINILKYEVEKSMEGLNFNKVATQAATGLNGSDASYNWIDVNPVNGDNFYRVRSVGVSGEIKYSSIVKVNILKGNPGITVYPNPVTKGAVTVQFIDMIKGVYKLRLINTIGQIIFLQQLNHNGGNASQTLMLNRGVVNGTYKLEIIKPDNTIITKTLVITNQ